jgi:hypothetical protein
MILCWEGTNMAGAVWTEAGLLHRLNENLGTQRISKYVSLQ